MQVVRRYNQHRRDLTIDMICENCGATSTYDSAYDDDNFWGNVVPNFICSECNYSTIGLGLKPKDIKTKYPEGFQI